MRYMATNGLTRMQSPVAHEETTMKMAALIAITFVQMMLTPASRADANGSAFTASAQADLGASPGVQRIEGDGMPKMDINVTVGDATPSMSHMWYAQPIWIAVFVIGGVAVLTLLVMALRGSGSGGSTVVKV
jgi:hypothetical protein